jgi:hypothetical protein
MTSKTHASVVAAWNRLWQTEKNRTTAGTTDSTPIIQEQSRNKQANQTNDNINSQSIHQTLCSEPKKLRRSKHHRHPPHEADNDKHTKPNSDAIHKEEEYGNQLTRKPDRILRIWLQNINRLPAHQNTIKSKKLVSTIVHKQVDIALMTKIGLYWKMVKQSGQWYERTQEAFQASRSSMAYNKNKQEMTAMIQFGGVGIMATDDTTHRIVEQGNDLTGLGCWTWMQLEGKQKHFLCVVTAYRPVINTSHGPGTVHAQNEHYLSNHD